MKGDFGISLLFVPPHDLSGERQLIDVHCNRMAKFVGGRSSVWLHSAMITDGLKALPPVEKFQLMEALWEDLREHFDRMDLSESQKALLDRRRASVELGESRLHDWDTVKGSIGRA